MVKGTELRRLEYDDKGRVTLDGKIVKATRIGFPIMAYFHGKMEDNGKVSFDEISCPSLLAHPMSAVYEAKAGTIAYALAIGESPIELARDKEKRDYVYIRKWTAVQFYKLSDKKKE